MDIRRLADAVKLATVRVPDDAAHQAEVLKLTTQLSEAQARVLEGEDSRGWRRCG